MKTPKKSKHGKRSQVSNRTSPAKRRWLFGVLGGGAFIGLLGWAVVQPEGSGSQVPIIAYEVVNRYPHDPNAFTQGLYYDDGFLFEGTGRYGQSSLRQVELETGRVLRETALPDRYFGEGIAGLGNRIYQLTWRSQLGFIYDKETLARIGQHTYAGEGWGLTEDGRNLIMSDGSATLRFLEPESFREVRRLDVRGPAGLVDQLNELEYIDGDIYANVWHTNYILRISAQSGQVTGMLDLTGPATEVQPADPEGVLNGIAYDAENGRMFVTGKLWPTLFELRL